MQQVREFPMVFQWFDKLKYYNLFAKHCQYYYFWITGGPKCL